jgi:hypothetical protein
MAKKRVADVLIETLVAAGVKRVYGLFGRSRPGAVFCIANRLRLFREHRLDARSLKAFQPQRCGLISITVIFKLHHRVNFPSSVPGKMASPVRLILGRMANVPVCLSY